MKISRKKFIESQGAKCSNWRWSWSFVNRKDKIVIFGAWKELALSDRSLILQEKWEYSPSHRKNPAFKESLENIRLIEEEGYQLKTFPMIYSGKDIYNYAETAKIGEFIPELYPKILKKIGKEWFAFEKGEVLSIPEEIINPQSYFEGACNTITVNAYERNVAARKKCIEYYGCKCYVCSFNFQEVYGDLGKDYIHVHHLTPLYKVGKRYRLDPINDLRPVCPNCHAIIHRTQEVLDIENLRNFFRKNRDSTTLFKS